MLATENVAWLCTSNRQVPYTLYRTDFLRE
jgi:hypothetical protein